MGEAQFFSGWIFGTRSDMSRIGEPADTRAAVFAAENGGEGEERRGGSERGREGDCDCECEMHLSSLARVG